MLQYIRKVMPTLRGYTVDVVPSKTGTVSFVRKTTAEMESDLEYWYIQWKSSEQLMFADGMSSIAVLLALIGEKILQDRMLGVRLLSLPVRR